MSGFKSEPLPLLTVQHVGFHRLSIRPPRPPALQGDRNVLLHLSNLFLPRLMFLASSDTNGHSSVTSERDTTVLGHLFTASTGFGIAISQAPARIVSCPIVEKCEQHHWACQKAEEPLREAQGWSQHCATGKSAVQDCATTKPSQAWCEPRKVVQQTTSLAQSGAIHCPCEQLSGWMCY